VARVETSAVSRLLDRLIRSRMWIFLVAFALIGIVAMQLWLLKLNGGIGRAIEHESYLQRANAALSAENSAKSAGDLVEQNAIANGMTNVWRRRGSRSLRRNQQLPPLRRRQPHSRCRNQPLLPKRRRHLHSLNPRASRCPVSSAA
jgi:hypothetical protein